MTKKADDKLGYEFEDELKKQFKEIQARHPFFWHQFPDTKAARNFIAAQPSDFLVASADRGTVLLEAKASEEKPTLAACFKSHISPSQIGMHKKYHRAGQDTLFIFYCEIDNRVELWNGKYVTDCVSEERKMDSLNSMHLLTICEYPDIKEMLLKYFFEGV